MWVWKMAGPSLARPPPTLAGNRIFRYSVCLCVCVHNGVPRTPLPAHDCPLMPHSHSSSNAYATQPRPAQCDTTTTAGLARRQRNAKKITYKH